MLPSLQLLSDNSLLDFVKNLKQVENQTLAELMLYLSEVDTRKLYRAIGFSRLFAYCTKELRYSEGAAYRRIQTGGGALKPVDCNLTTLCLLHWVALTRSQILDWYVLRTINSLRKRALVLKRSKVTFTGEVQARWRDSQRLRGELAQK